MNTIDITPIVNATLALIGAGVSVFLIPWLKKQTTEAQRKELTAWVKIGVAAAEQLYVGQGRGEEKKQPPRFKGMRVRDLLCIAAGNEKLPQSVCCDYLTQVGLCANDYLEREVDTSLSGGEVKRIEIATVLARKGSMLLFDEPEAGIDLWSFARLTETFSALHSKREATMIIISHQERIIGLADEIVVIAGGCIRHRGDRETILPLILSNTTGGCALGKECSIK